ncbi:MAG: FtsX-like permease family protein [Alphaproteobacteria bacterium]|nr:FtsX-like permease family protein [Alphaproteobacteria bacterium]
MTPPDPGSAGLALAWRIARRELRGGVRGFRVFLVCLLLGVAAIAAVGTLSRAVQAGLAADARTLLGGDVDIRTLHRPLSAEQDAHLARTGRQTARTRELKAMAHRGDARALVELKAVDGAYPLTGSVDLDPPRPLHDLLAERGGRWGAIAEKSLLDKLGVAVGGALRVGGVEFEVRGQILREPDRVTSIVNFGPRLMIANAALDQTGLVQPGSQIRHHVRVLLPERVNPDTYMKELDTAFPQAGWRLHGPAEAAPGLKAFIDRLTQFLTFAGLTALLVGGIGVSGAVRGFLGAKTGVIATYKCLGAPGALVFRIYLLQILALAGLGVALGLAVGVALPWVGTALLGDLLPVQPRMTVYPAALAKAAGFGFLVAVTFALWPLAVARETRAANLFRTQVVEPRVRPRLAALLGVGAMAALLAGLIVWTEPDTRFALAFVAASAGAVLLLHLGGRLAMAAAKRAPRPKNALAAMALGNLHRPGADTPGVVLALGIGLTVLVAVAEIQGNVSRQIRDTIPEQAPALFFIDILDHQAEGFDDAVQSVPGVTGIDRMPSLRGRIVTINGRPVDEVTVDPAVAWAVRGDRALTYAARPRPGTVFTAGAWWPDDYAGPPAISLDARVAKGFGIGVGDTLTVNVLGRDVTATVLSLRDIDWRTLRFDFAIIFAPGVLEHAPHGHIAAVKANPGTENALERAVTDRFANISAIRVRDALDAANRILEGIGWAITGTASVTLLAGIVVLAGAIAAARTRRIHDAVVFKVLGATRAQIMAAFLLEYGFLGLLAGSVSILAGTAVAWAVIRHVMAMTWSFEATEALVTLFAAVAITLAAAFLGTWRALGEKAGRRLRNE